MSRSSNQNTPVEPPVTPAGGPEPTWREAMALPLAALGGILGGVAGGVVFAVLWNRELYGPFIVGGGVGMGARLLARKGSPVIGTVAAVIALPASLVAEWWVAPFTADGSFPFFLSHLSAGQWLMHGLGAAIAGFIAWRK